MKHIYNINGLPFADEREIKLRRWLEDTFALELRTALLRENPAWRFVQIEGPLLTPVDKISSNYTNEDVWMQEVIGTGQPLVLRPETTPASYAYASMLLQTQQTLPPVVVWQAGKSFRREQDQATKHCRFKEFYQQEFQCIYSASTANDYQAKIAPDVERMIATVLKLPTRLVDSDRLPSYSLRTLDVEVNNGDKWMEVCSISLRTDFPAHRIGNKDVELRVLEVAIGLDRCVYNFTPPVAPDEQ